MLGALELELELLGLGALLVLVVDALLVVDEHCVRFTVNGAA